MVSNKQANSKKTNPIFKSQARNEQNSESNVFGAMGRQPMAGFGLNPTSGGQQAQGQGNKWDQKENDEYSYNIPSGGAFYSASHLPNMMAQGNKKYQQPVEQKYND